MSKAFFFNLYGLATKLIDHSLPMNFISIILDRYTNGSISVRQIGRVSYPVLFVIFPKIFFYSDLIWITSHVM